MNRLSAHMGRLRDVLLEISVRPTTLELLAGKISTPDLKPSEVELSVILGKRLGFITHNKESNLEICGGGNEFIKFVNSMSETRELDPENIPPAYESHISATIPHFYLPLPLQIKNKIEATSETMKSVISNSNRFTYIVTPLLDIALLQSMFENVMRKPQAEITIITSEDKLIEYAGSNKGNLRLDDFGKLLKSRYSCGGVYYVKKDMSIMHSKILCSERSLLVTSANIKKNSITENFELGLFTENKDMVNTVAEILKFVINSSHTRRILNVGGS